MEKLNNDLDPFALMVEQIVSRVGNEFENRLQSTLSNIQAVQLLDSSKLEPMKAYSAEEVAGWLGINRVESVYEIPNDELPRVRRIGRNIGYLGINVLCYMHNLPPVDIRAVTEGYRDRLMQERPNVIPLHPHSEEKTRVL